MFTGIIHGTGKIVQFEAGRTEGKLSVFCSISLKGVLLGESIAVDGCCLTVTRRRQKTLIFDLSGETLKKTKLSSYRPGTKVNLERAMKGADRFGGHFVLGHVDGVGRVESVCKMAGSTEMVISYPKTLARWLIEKGSVTVDGISLTASLTGRNRFTVFIIPHTARVTNIGSKKPGDLVNLEMDVLGKYVERLISKNRSYRT